MIRCLTFSLIVGLATPSCQCQQTPAPPNPPSFLVDKSIFRADRRWYVWNTVTDAPYHPTAVSFIGITEPTEKIRWEIQEGLLVGYRAYSLYWGDPASTAGAPTHTDPVVAFRILGHFDLFNNQIVSAPRKSWADKQYMQVDWTENLVPSGAAPWSKTIPSPIGFAITDPKDPDAPVVTDGFIRITSRYGFSEQGYQSQWASHTAPLCSGDPEFMLCEPSEFTWRREMWPVDESDDYVAMDLTGAQRLRFGNFSKSALYIDPAWGATDTGRRFLAARFNLWKRSHDENGKELPLYQRELEPLYWHLSRDWPDALRDAAAQGLSDWNDVFREAINSARVLTCTKDGRTDCERYRDPNLQVVRLCPHNPPQAGDPAECGAAGVEISIGDTRHNMLAWVKQPVAGAAAVGWWNVDHETGEIISGNAYFNGIGITTHINEIALAIQLMNKDVEATNSFLAGDDVAQWINSRFAASPFGPYPVGTLGQPLGSIGTAPWPGIRVPVGSTVDPAQLAARGAQLDTSWLSTAGLPPLDTSSPVALDESVLARVAHLRKQGVFTNAGAEADARVRALWDTPIEAALTTPDDLMVAGLFGRTATTADQASAFRAAASPLRPRASLEFPQWINAEPLRTGVLDVVNGARAAQYKGQPLDAIAAALLKIAMRSLVSHELGHTLGFKHNFSGSFDALNYQADYWRLRNDGSMGPRWRDPVTQAELDGFLFEYAYSSVMDYVPSLFERSHGLGHYDRAATKFIYGGVVEVLDDPLAKQNAKLAAQLQLWHDSALATRVFLDGATLRGVHYTQYPALFGNLEARSDVLVSDLRDPFGYGVPLVTADGRPAVPYRYCNDAQERFFATCYRDDRGADPYEIAQDRMQRFYSYYWNTHFRRHRQLYPMPDLGFTTEYFQKLTATWVLNTLSVPDPAILSTDDGLAAATLAVTEGFDFLADIVTLPEPGRYEPLPDAARQTVYSWTGYGTGASFDVPLGEGRFFGSALAPIESGPDWASQVKWWGAMFDKRAAVDALTTPFDAAPNSESAQDPRTLVASYAVVLPSQLEQLLGAVLAGDALASGPTVDLANKALVRRRWTNPMQPWAPAPGTALDPSIGYNLRSYLQSVAFARLAAPLRGVLLDSMRVVVVGSSDDFTTTSPTVTFADPNSGKTYRALSRIRSGQEVGIGARMLGRANALLAIQQDMMLPVDQRVAAAQELAAWVRELEMLRAEALMFDHVGGK